MKYVFTRKRKEALKKAQRMWKIMKHTPRTKYGYHQTGKIKNIKKDRSLKAILPGWRISKAGKKYYEARRNRTDMIGKTI